MCKIMIVFDSDTQRGSAQSRMTVRLPTQIVFSNSLCFPYFFPVQPHIFPVPIYIIYDYILHTQN